MTQVDTHDLGSVAACGAESAACCAGDTCDSGLSCDTGLCVQARAGDTGKPCTRNADCASGLCLPLGGGMNVCTTTCAVPSACVAGWTCMPLTGQSGNVCQCAIAGAETCNGKDDDCDGIVDNTVVVNAKCAAAMNGSPICRKGACTCASPCGGRCPNLDSDPANCGGCGMACAAATMCVKGTCACNNGLTACGGKCIDATADATNCGACGHACPGTACRAGACDPIKVARLPNAITELVLTSDYGYWLSASSSTVGRVPLAGGNGMVLGLPMSDTHDLALYNSTLYWIDSNAIVQRTIDTGMQMALLTRFNPLRGLGVTGGAIFYGEPQAGTLVQTDLLGKSPRTVQTGTTVSQVVTGTDVFWYDQMQRTLWSAQVGSGSGVQLASNVSCDGIARVGGGVLCCSAAGDSCTSYAGAAMRMVAKAIGLKSISGLAADASAAYLADGKASLIWKIDLNSGVASKLANASAPGGIAIDAMFVYWSQNLDLVKVPR